MAYLTLRDEGLKGGRPPQFSHFFTLLNSLFTPPVSLLPVFPEGVRLLNVLIGTVLLCFISYLFMTLLTPRQRFVSIAGVALVFFASPITTFYFFVARGYLLGALLLLGSIYALTRTRYYVASGLFALSAWTVLTYLYCVPLIYLVTFLLTPKDARRTLLLSALLLPVLLILLYAPAAHSVLSNAKTYNAISLGAFFTSIWHALGNFASTRLDQSVEPHNTSLAARVYETLGTTALLAGYVTSVGVLFDEAISE